MRREFARTLAPFATAAATAVLIAGPAGAVDWERLEGDAWGGDGAARPQAQDPFVGEVAKAFQDLGMAEARAVCYGEVLLVKLKPRNREAAVALLVDAEDASEVRERVTVEGFDVIGGFRAANRDCPESMGG